MIVQEVNSYFPADLLYVKLIISYLSLSSNMVYNDRQIPTIIALFKYRARYNSKNC